jgi:hypothetical protein
LQRQQPRGFHRYGKTIISFIIQQSNGGVGIGRLGRRRSGFLSVVKGSEGIRCQALRLKEKVQGQEHPDTLTSMDNLANVLREPMIRLTQLKPFPG